MKHFVTVLCCILLMMSMLQTKELAITITEPQAGTAFESCTDIQITAEIQQNDSIPIYSVVFYRNRILLRTIRNAPYTYLWKNVPPGYYLLIAKVTDDSANVAYSDPVWITVGQRPAPNLISNGYFDCGTKAPWQQMEYEGADASRVF
jgi:hypothetical protein